MWIFQNTLTLFPKFCRFSSESSAHILWKFVSHVNVLISFVISLVYLKSIYVVAFLGRVNFSKKVIYNRLTAITVIYYRLISITYGIKSVVVILFKNNLFLFFNNMFLLYTCYQSLLIRSNIPRFSQDIPSFYVFFFQGF